MKGRRLRVVLSFAALAGALVAPVVERGLDAQEPPRALRMNVRPEGWIGFTFDLELQQAWQTGAPVAAPTMVISTIYPESPAARVGLQVGDTIVRIDRQAVSVDGLARLQANLTPGRRVDLEYRRAGRLRSVTVQAATRPPDDVLEWIPPQVRIQVESARASLFQTLDSAAREGMPGEGVSVFLFRQGDSMRVSVPAPRLAPPLPGAAFERTWTVAAGQERAPFGGVIPRQPTPAQAAAQDARRAATEQGQRQTELEAVRAELAAVTQSLGVLEQHSRPLAPYILGQDVIAGARLTPVNPGLAVYFGVERGLLVVEVAEGTPAADAGISPGDVIVSSGPRSLATVEEMRALFTGQRGAGNVPLTLIRKGRRFQLSLPR